MLFTERGSFNVASMSEQCCPWPDFSNKWIWYLCFWIYICHFRKCDNTIYIICAKIIFYCLHKTLSTTGYRSNQRYPYVCPFALTLQLGFNCGICRKILCLASLKNMLALSYFTSYVVKVGQKYQTLYKNKYGCLQYLTKICLYTRNKNSVPCKV